MAPFKTQNGKTLAIWERGSKKFGMIWRQGCEHTHLLNVLSRPQPPPHSNRSCSSRMDFLRAEKMVVNRASIWVNPENEQLGVAPCILNVLNSYIIWGTKNPLKITGVNRIRLSHPLNPPSFGTKEWSNLQMLATRSFREAQLSWDGRCMVADRDRNCKTIDSYFCFLGKSSNWHPNQRLQCVSQK